MERAFPRDLRDVERDSSGAFLARSEGEHVRLDFPLPVWNGLALETHSVGLIPRVPHEHGERHGLPCARGDTVFCRGDIEAASSADRDTADRDLVDAIVGRVGEFEHRVVRDGRIGIHRNECRERHDDRTARREDESAFRRERTPSVRRTEADADFRPEGSVARIVADVVDSAAERRELTGYGWHRVLGAENDRGGGRRPGRRSESEHAEHYRRPHTHRTPPGTSLDPTPGQRRRLPRAATHHALPGPLSTAPHGTRSPSRAAPTPSSSRGAHARRAECGRRRPSAS